MTAGPNMLPAFDYIEINRCAIAAAIGGDLDAAFQGFLFRGGALAWSNNEVYSIRHWATPDTPLSPLPPAKGEFLS